jgi:two-component system response regulator DevR
MIRILIVDDHFVVRVGLRSLIGTYPDLSVAGEAGSVEEAVAASCCSTSECPMAEACLR